MEVKIFNYLPDDAQMIRQKVFVDEQGFKEEFDIYVENHIVKKCNLETFKMMNKRIKKNEDKYLEK